MTTICSSAETKLDEVIYMEFSSYYPQMIDINEFEMNYKQQLDHISIGAYFVQHVTSPNFFLTSTCDKCHSTSSLVSNPSALDELLLNDRQSFSIITHPSSKWEKNQVKHMLKFEYVGRFRRYLLNCSIYGVVCELNSSYDFRQHLCIFFELQLTTFVCPSVCR
ncbi:hypothetical protein E1A91_A06G047800v1 [Gossypium mustelinum]|uniref:Uncharacterized protein n=1 Tax=Gossypium mustelinum TaxID=34275 RepID=A0A5D2YVP5_GOSMU|nr:hypothetical protein E1A91_A06G047800v1 [Gossypium mustelinum]